MASIFPGPLYSLPPTCCNLVIAAFKKAIYGAILKKLIYLRIDHRELGVLLVECAVEVENIISCNVIKASWNNVGLFPFNGEKIVAHAEKNVGIIESDAGTICHAVRTAAMEVIHDFLDPPPTANPISNLSVHPTPNQLFIGEEILHLHEEKVREDEEKKQERENTRRKVEEEKREAALIREQRKTDYECRGTQHDGGRKPVWKSSGDWIWCDYCNDFGLCSKCKVPDKLVMIEHERVCGGSD